MSEIKPYEYDVIICEITKSLIDDNNYEEILGFYEELLKDPIKYENKLVLMISGYDNDSRELFEINEVREYFSVLDKMFPYWFYFLNKDLDYPHSSLGVLIFILVPVQNVVDAKGLRRVEFDLGKLKDFIKNHFDYLNELTDRLDLSEKETLRISKDVDKCLSALFKLNK